MKLFYYSHLGEEKGEADSKLPPGESAPSFICNHKPEGNEESAGANNCIEESNVYKSHDTCYLKPLYQARESILVPFRLLTVHFL